VDPLPVFTGARISAANIDVSVTEFQQRVLPATVYSALPAPFDGGTLCWGYKVGGTPHFPGFTIEAQRGTPTIVTYNNDLPLAPFLQKYLTVDQTLNWAEPLGQMGSVARIIVWWAPQHVPVNAVGPGVNLYRSNPPPAQDMSGIAISWITKTTI